MSRLVAQTWDVNGCLQSVAFDAMASHGDQSFIANEQLTAEKARNCLADLANLEPLPDMSAAVDVGERVRLVDWIIHIARYGRSGVADTTIEPPGRYSFVNASIDWDIVLETIHGHLDNIVATMQVPDHQARTADLDRVTTEAQAQAEMTHIEVLAAKSMVVGREATSRKVAWQLLTELAPAFGQARVAETRAAARERLTRIGFALRIHQREQGDYPATLEELTPDPLHEIPLDPFTDAPLVYHRTDDGGFRLYSVGDNRTDDGGATYDSEPEGDDIILEVRPE